MNSIYDVKKLIDGVQKKLQDNYTDNDFKLMESMSESCGVSNIYNQLYPIRIQCNIKIYKDKIEIETEELNDINMLTELKNKLKLKTLNSGL